MKRRFTYKKLIQDSDWDSLENVVSDMWSNGLYLLTSSRDKYIEYAYNSKKHARNLELLTESLKSNKVLRGYELLEISDHKLNFAEVKKIKYWRDDYGI